MIDTINSSYAHVKIISILSKNQNKKRKEVRLKGRGKTKAFLKIKI
jgi:hypothetical protein